MDSGPTEPKLWLSQAIRYSTPMPIYIFSIVYLKRIFFKNSVL